MPVMSSDDFSVHTAECTQASDGMPISDFPDEVTSIDDLDCEYWDAYDSLTDLT